MPRFGRPRARLPSERRVSNTPEWITVAVAAGLMNLSKRQALRLLSRRNRDAGGGLLRSIGTKRMPRGPQSSKYLVSVTVLFQTMRPDDATARDIESLRLEIALLTQQMGAIRRTIGPLKQAFDAWNATQRDARNT